MFLPIIFCIRSNNAAWDLADVTRSIIGLPMNVTLRSCITNWSATRAWDEKDSVEELVSQVGAVVASVDRMLWVLLHGQLHEAFMNWEEHLSAWTRTEAWPECTSVVAVECLRKSEQIFCEALHSIE